MTFLTEDFAKNNSLSTEQVQALTTAINDYSADLKKEYAGVANENAEKIIQGALTSTQERFGVTAQREQGEKMADYLARVTPLVIDSKLSEEKKAVEALKADFEEKIKSGKFDEALKADFEKLKATHSEVLKREAELSDKLTGMVPKEDYDNALLSMKNYKENQALNDVKPRFAESVNEYEARAKWNDFVKDIKEKYDIEVDADGVAVFKEKNNEYKTGKLSDLVAKNETLQALVTGRQVTGAGAKKPTEKLENVPFLIPENITSAEKSKMITDYLIKNENLSKTSSEYAKRFAEINTAILKGKKL